ncbi:hypothetical protein J4H86_06700 [Spiractinospora alimapuensis]|uniref:hypothetical protein n=1 Tax=Spiractinospora alimapuensis TaxID=2820884 RepID=UPI001F4614E9|nr:hypothetical protein [Spiractinospora alimapuensis]QVQ53442.1 hypothetical protein J4H86_06700 [Spiractinospora alimapuensis]
MRWRTGSFVGGALSLILVAGCVSEQTDDPEPEEGEEEAAEEEPQISDADLSGLAVLHVGSVPVDPEENPRMSLAFYDPADGTLRTSLAMRGLEEDTGMSSRDVVDILAHSGPLPEELDFSADFRRMVWENAETGAVHVAELDDQTAEYQLLRSVEIDVGETISGDQPRYSGVNLSPDGSQLWFVSAPEDGGAHELLFVDLDDDSADGTPQSWGAAPEGTGTVPGDEDAFWDITWDNELQILERDTTSGDGYSFDFYAEGDTIVPAQLTLQDLGSRTGAHGYASFRQTSEDTYIARSDSGFDEDSQLLSFRVTDEHEITDIELLTEPETYIADAYPDLENNELLVVEYGTKYRPFYARPLEGTEEPRHRFDELEESEELAEVMHRENILGVYPEDKSESAVIPQLR